MNVVLDLSPDPPLLDDLTLNLPHADLLANFNSIFLL